MSENEKIKDFLISKGWENSEDMFSKTIERESNSVTIINGAQIKQPLEKYQLEIEYQGEGSIESTPIYGYSINVNGAQHDTMYTYDLDGFINEIYSTIE